MRLRILPVMIAALLTLGAGCTATQPPGTNTPNTGVKGETDTTNTGTNTPTASDITLTGSITGPNSVNLKWDANR